MDDAAAPARGVGESTTREMLPLWCGVPPLPSGKSVVQTSMPIKFQYSKKNIQKEAVLSFPLCQQQLLARYGA